MRQGVGNEEEIRVGETLSSCHAIEKKSNVVAPGELLITKEGGRGGRE